MNDFPASKRFVHRIPAKSFCKILVKFQFRGVRPDKIVAYWLRLVRWNLELQPRPPAARLCERHNPTAGQNGEGEDSGACWNAQRHRRVFAHVGVSCHSCVIANGCCDPSEQQQRQQ